MAESSPPHQLPKNILGDNYDVIDPSNRCILVGESRRHHGASPVLLQPGQREVVPPGSAVDGQTVNFLK